MIAKVVRGYRPGGLLRYLFGPGQHEEHVEPRVVASWDGAPWLHQPEPVPRPDAGEFDLDLRLLIATMEAEPRRLGLPLRTPPALPEDWRQALVDGRRLPADAPAWARMWRYDAKLGDVVLRPGYVWHCPVRLAPNDRTLSDGEWERIAERLMRATGIHQAGCRWVAVRHADDHIHLMATLVSETTGKRFHPYRDFYALREECRAIEREFGLTETAPADRTARPAPTRAERAKAERSHRSETPRDELHRLVSHAAATTATGETFLHALRERGLDPLVRRGESGQVVGYTVALPGDVTASGEKVRYAGRALAPDLTWPKLHNRWASAADRPSTTPANLSMQSREQREAARLEREAAMSYAIDAANAGAGLLSDRTRSVRDLGSDADPIAHAVGELLVVLAVATGTTDGERHLSESARRFDRAARTPYRVVTCPDSALARELRIAARRIAASGPISGRGRDRAALIALVVAVAGLVLEIAALQHVVGRTQQASAAADAWTALSRQSQASTLSAAADRRRQLLSHHAEVTQQSPAVDTARRSVAYRRYVPPAAGPSTGGRRR